MRCRTPGRARHLLPIQQPGNEFKTFVHAFHTFQGILCSPQKAQLWTPCLRNELSPLSQERQTGHAGRGRAAAHHKPFQDWLSADYLDFRIIHFGLVDDGADIGAPEWRFTALDIRSHRLGAGRDFVLGDPDIRPHFGEPWQAGDGVGSRFQIAERLVKLGRASSCRQSGIESGVRRELVDLGEAQSFAPLIDGGWNIVLLERRI